MRLVTLTIALLLLAASAADARPTSCRALRADAVERALDYARERSAEGALATAPDLRIYITLERCQPQSRRRAVWGFRLTVRDESNRLIDDRGDVTITRRRATWRVLNQPGA